jgi:hypothetical protein
MAAPFYTAAIIMVVGCERVKKGLELIECDHGARPCDVVSRNHVLTNHVLPMFIFGKVSGGTQALTQDFW